MKKYQNFFVPLPPNEANDITAVSIDDAFAVLGKGRLPLSQDYNG